MCMHIVSKTSIASLKLFLSIYSNFPSVLMTEMVCIVVEFVKFSSPKYAPEFNFYNSCLPFKLD